MFFAFAVTAAFVRWSGVKEGVDIERWMIVISWFLISWLPFILLMWASVIIANASIGDIFKLMTVGAREFIHTQVHELLLWKLTFFRWKIILIHPWHLIWEIKIVILLYDIFFFDSWLRIKWVKWRVLPLFLLFYSFHLLTTGFHSSQHSIRLY